jgi:hypothetical protein
MKIAVFWDVAPSRSCVNQRFGVTYRLLTIAGCFRLVTQSAATSSRWFLTCEFFYPEDGGDTFPETSVYIRLARRYIPEDCILHSHRRENLKSYIKKPSFLLHSYAILNLPVDDHRT